jgi:DNA-3-methyladenine glycosylase
VPETTAGPCAVIAASTGIAPGRWMSPEAARDLVRRPAEEVAPRLLGSVVLFRAGEPGEHAGPGMVAVRLVEVEAYGGPGEDPPSWAHHGRTPANDVMFGEPGRALVRFLYGMHWTLNVVTGPEGTAGAVLLRAGEVIVGADAAGRRHGRERAAATLARGPALLARSLGVDASLGGVDLLCRSEAPLGSAAQLLVPSDLDAAQVRSGPRVGVSTGVETPWRFWLADDVHVSRYRSGGRGAAKHRATSGAGGAAKHRATSGAGGAAKHRATSGAA